MMSAMASACLEATYEESKRGHQRPGRGGPVRVWKLPIRNPSGSKNRASTRATLAQEATYKESKPRELPLYAIALGTGSRSYL